ncbi:MAG: zinc-binding dehydrogenase [Candidatus Eremiobacteraeota bacterium]|nr:zinc-binding dehydrogenase [Candidatus Eremiobacteraeota bacterium]
MRLSNDDRMLALRYEAFGDPVDVADVAEVATPEPGPGQVRVRVLRSPIHNHDLATMRGTYGYKPQLPAFGGTELAGEIDAVGKGVEHLSKGQRITAAIRAGAWAQFAIVPAFAAVPVPDAIPDDVASQLLAMPLSAVVLFDELRTQPGMWIGQNAAGGAVGRVLMRLAQANGVNVVNIVRSETAAEDLRKYGARYVVVTDESDAWQRKIRELTGGKGLARIVDSVAGPQTLMLQRVLAERGEIIIFGGLSGAPIKLDPSLMISLECTVRGFWMSTWMECATHEQRAQAIQRVFEDAIRGELPLPVARAFPLTDAKSALAAAQTPGRGGKVLFAP